MPNACESPSCAIQCVTHNIVLDAVSFTSGASVRSKTFDAQHSCSSPVSACAYVRQAFSWAVDRLRNELATTIHECNQCICCSMLGCILTRFFCLKRSVNHFFFPKDAATWTADSHINPAGGTHAAAAPPSPAFQEKWSRRSAGNAGRARHSHFQSRILGRILDGTGCRFLYSQVHTYVRPVEPRFVPGFIP
jgi:hypothetical protein